MLMVPVENAIDSLDAFILLRCLYALLMRVEMHNLYQAVAPNNKKDLGSPKSFIDQSLAIFIARKASASPCIIAIMQVYYFKSDVLEPYSSTLPIKLAPSLTSSRSQIIFPLTCPVSLIVNLSLHSISGS